MTHVLVLAGGLSHERDVSLRSGRRVADALARAGCETHVRDVDSSLLDTISATRPDVVWPVLHGATGEDGALRDVLQTLADPVCRRAPGLLPAHVGQAGRQGSRRAAGVSTPAASRSRTPPSASSGPPLSWPRWSASLGLPLAVKPARGGSALGLSIVRTAEELPTAMVGCLCVR